MLTPEQITALGDTAEVLTEPLVDWLIQDIAERVAEAGQLTSTAAYEVWRAQNLGLSLEDIKKRLQKKLGVTSSQLETLLTQAAETGYNFDISRFPTSHAIPLSANASLQQILNATVALAKDDLSNMTQTIGFVGTDGVCRELTDAYNQACDFAFQKISTGAQDYMSAIRDATKNLAEKGIRWIDYESGVHTSMEAAVRRNMMGALGLMQEQISQQNHDDLGCDGWEISAHGASAPDHEPIQGKQYSDKEYTNLNNSLVRRIGTLNCGHAAFPIILGVNEPQYSAAELEQLRRENEEGVTCEGKHYTLYEASQRQRKFERTIRKQKRRILVDEAVGDKDKLQNDQIRYHVVEQEYRRFSKAAGLPTQHARMETAGFDWKKGKAAEEAASGLLQNVVKHEASIHKEKINRNKTRFADKLPAEKQSKTPNACWDNSRGTKSWKADRYKRLVSDEQTSVQSPVEIGTLYNAEGERVFRLEGEAAVVNFTDAQIKQMNGGVLTHNHPGSDYGCFSPHDINMLCQAHLCEVRCATPIGVFSIQHPVKWPSAINDFDKIEDVYYNIYELIGKDYYARVWGGEISPLEAENLTQRATVEEMCKRYKLPFRFESWNDLAKG